MDHERDGDFFLSFDIRILDYSSSPSLGVENARPPYSRAGGDVCVAHPDDLAQVFYAPRYTDFDVFNLGDALAILRPPWFQFAQPDTDTLQHRADQIEFQPTHATGQPSPYAPSEWKHYSFNLCKAIREAWSERIPDIGSYEFFWAGCGMEYFSEILGEIECDNLFVTRGHPVYMDFARSKRDDVNVVSHLYATQSIIGDWEGDTDDAFDGNDNTDTPLKRDGSGDLILEVSFKSRNNFPWNKTNPPTPSLTAAEHWVNALRLKTENSTWITKASLYAWDVSESLPVLEFENNSSGDKVFYFSPVETSQMRLVTTENDVEWREEGDEEEEEYFLDLAAFELFFHEDINTHLGNLAVAKSGYRPAPTASTTFNLPQGEVIGDINDGDIDESVDFGAPATTQNPIACVINFNCLRRTDCIKMYSPNHSIHDVEIYFNEFPEGTDKWRLCAVNTNSNAVKWTTLYFSSLMTDKIKIKVTNSGGDDLEIGEVRLYRSSYSINPPIDGFAITTDRNYGQPADSIPSPNRVQIEARRILNGSDNGEFETEEGPTVDCLISPYDPSVPEAEHAECVFDSELTQGLFLDLNLDFGVTREIDFISFSTKGMPLNDVTKKPEKEGVPTDYEFYAWDPDLNGGSGGWEASPLVSYTGNKNTARGHSFPRVLTSKIKMRIKSFRDPYDQETPEKKPHLKWISAYNHEARFFDK